MRIRLDLDDETALALARAAGAELRPISLQAVVELRRALGLPIPIPRKNEATQLT